MLCLVQGSLAERQHHHASAHVRIQRVGPAFNRTGLLLPGVSELAVPTRSFEHHHIIKWSLQFAALKLPGRLAVEYAT